MLELFSGIEPDQNGLLTVETNIMSENGRNQIFVWKPKQEACAIWRVYERMHTQHNCEYSIKTEKLLIVIPALLIPLILRVYMIIMRIQVIGECIQQSDLSIIGRILIMI